MSQQLPARTGKTGGMVGEDETSWASVIAYCQLLVLVQVPSYLMRAAHTFVGTACRETWPEPDSLLATALSLTPCQAHLQVLPPTQMHCDTCSNTKICQISPVAITMSGFVTQRFKALFLRAVVLPLVGLTIVTPAELSTFRCQMMTQQLTIPTPAGVTTISSPTRGSATAHRSQASHVTQQGIYSDTSPSELLA